LNLTYDEALSSFAFSFNLRHYTEADGPFIYRFRLTAIPG
jgi:hypothetical protein